MSRPLYIYPLIFLATLSNSPQALPQEYKKFETDYTTIYYSQDSQLDSFLWKIGHLRLGPSDEASLAKSRVDRIVERVEAVLNMYPENFFVEIFLRSGYKDGNIALYSDMTRSITVFAERVTDGVLAHEIAHAVLHRYFGMPLSSKIQEILCQYVDAYLWRDYY